MKKSDIIEGLASTLDVEKLLAEYPALGRDGLKLLLKEAATAIGPGSIEPPKKVAAKSRSIVDRISGDFRRNRSPSSAAAKLASLLPPGASRCRNARSAARTAR